MALLIVCALLQGHDSARAQLTGSVLVGGDFGEVLTPDEEGRIEDAVGRYLPGGVEEPNEGVRSPEEQEEIEAKVRALFGGSTIHRPVEPEKSEIVRELLGLPSPPPPRPGGSPSLCQAAARAFKTALDKCGPGLVCFRPDAGLLELSDQQTVRQTGVEFDSACMGKPTRLQGARLEWEPSVPPQVVARTAVLIDPSAPRASPAHVFCGAYFWTETVLLTARHCFIAEDGKPVRTFGSVAVTREHALSTGQLKIGQGSDLGLVRVLKGTLRHLIPATKAYSDGSLPPPGDDVIALDLQEPVVSACHRCCQALRTGGMS
jgi:hypothetical protein